MADGAAADQARWLDPISAGLSLVRATGFALAGPYCLSRPS